MVATLSRLLVAILLVTGVATNARAEEQREDLPTPVHEEPHPRHAWVWDSLSALRLNPQGAVVRARTGYRLQLWDRPGLLFRESFASAKGAVDLTPAYLRLGGEVELQPLAALRLWARYDYLQSFGSYSYTQSFNSPNADYSDSTKRDRVSYRAKGQQLTVGGYLQGKLGQFAARTQFEGATSRIDIRAGDTVFYDGWVDALVPNGGWSVISDNDLLWLAGSGLIFSLRYSFAHVLYREGDYDNPADQSTQNNTPWHRLGPVVHYTLGALLPADRQQYAPSVALLAQWWLQHRFRTGQDSHQAIPFMLLVLFQQGDFL